MKPSTDAKVRRIVSCSGRSWYSNANGAGDYLFNPVFMNYFFLCVVLYATLMQPSEAAEVPFHAQLVFWGGLIFTSLAWLFLSVSASLFAFDRGMTKAIYMPLVLLPLVMINVLVGEFMLASLSHEFEWSYGGALENFVQNTIALVAFEIMHSRFVAPHHPRYLGPELPPDNQTMPSHIDTAHASADTQSTKQPTSWMVETQDLDADLPEVGQIQGPVLQSEAVKEEDARKIVLAHETLDVAEIVWIKSEDHYLSVQMKDQNLMLRAKLSSTVEELGDQLGLQINRSVWVAYDAIRTVDYQTNGNVELHLDGDAAFRVSKARNLIFRQNYERFKKTNA